MLIVILFNLPWKHTADYAHKTADILTQNHTVVCYMHKEAKSIKEYVLAPKGRLFWRKHKKGFLYYPLYIIPFRRFHFIDEINTFINLIVLRTLMWWKFRQKIFNKKILWVFDPECFFMVRAFNSSYKTLYDCVDYHKDSHAQKEDELISMCTFFFVNSQTLYNVHRQKRNYIMRVPQGFRLQEFQRALRKRTQPTKSSNPVIGYIGGINNRLDYTLLLQLVQKTPQYEYVFVGPVQQHGAKDFIKNVKPSIDRLFSFPNVYHEQEIFKKEIPFIISRFDVAIIPYRMDASYNKYCFPTKVFEYFYMGKPVVSTPIEELKRFPKFIKMSASALGWQKHIHSVLKKPWSVEYRKQQKNLASDNSWERKIGAMLKYINE